MSEPNQLPERVSELERQMTEVRRDATDALNLGRVLDRDGSDIRAERRADRLLLHALRDTQIDQGQEIRALRSDMHEGFARVDQRFVKVETEMREGFAQTREGFAKVGVGMAQMTAMLKIAIDQSDDS